MSADPQEGVQSRTFADLLRRERRAAGLTQAELAERAGLSVRVVSDLERGLILRPYRSTVRMLAQALELSEERYHALEAAVVRTRRSRRRPPRDSRTEARLPSYATQFVGRAHEMEMICGLFTRGDARLITLTGPGGVGKTRLAIQVATRLRDLFSDGVFFVSLGALADPALLPSTIAAALAVGEVGDKPIVQTLIDVLSNKDLLLVLDNFEHLIDTALIVSTLLSGAPGLRVLVTSRALLHLDGEHEIVVSPFSLPEGTRALNLERVSEYEAVALFVQRARAALASFAVSNDNVAAVTDICIRLDGLPLAIELAASRVKLFPPQTLLARLSSRLSLLTGGPRDLPTRHQSLRRTIEWSYLLLAEEEQRLFARLSLFAGGCSLAAVEALDGGASDALAGLTALIDNSLLTAREVEQGETRFFMLETIREYAADRLDASGERQQIEARHNAYFVALAESAAAELESDRQPAALARLERERDNFRAVLKRATEAGDAERAVRLAGALSPFWEARSKYREGTYWLDAALKLPGTVPAEFKARALLGDGGIAYFRGDYDRAERRLAESLAAYRGVGDTVGAAAALRRLGLVAWDRGEYDRAERLETESLELCRAAGHTLGIGGTLGTLGAIAYSRGDLERARSLYKESLAVLGDRAEAWTLAIQRGNLAAALMDSGDLADAEPLFQRALDGFQSLGQTRGATVILSNLGQLALLRGEIDEARAAHLEALELSREIGDQSGIARSLFCLADTALAAGDPIEAAGLYREALTIFHRLGHGQGIGWCLQGLACAAATTDPITAATLFGAAARLREEHGVDLVPWEQERQERYQHIARCSLGRERWDDAWARGHSLTAEEACRLEPG